MHRLLTLLDTVGCKGYLSTLPPHKSPISVADDEAHLGRLDFVQTRGDSEVLLGVREDTSEVSCGRKSSISRPQAVIVPKCSGALASQPLGFP